MRAAWSRRKLLANSGVALAALGWGAAARAQGGLAGQLGDLLENQLPAPLRAVLPGEAFEAAGFVRSLLALEGEARVLDLPRSILSRGDDQIPLDPEQLYGIAMPRLVALIDRSEPRNPGFADRAGDLLARLHRTQYVVPEGLADLLGRATEPAGGTSHFAAQETEPPPVEPDPPMVSEPVVQQLPTPTPAPEAGQVPVEPVAVPTTTLRSTRFADLADEFRAQFAAASIRPERQDQAEWHLTMMRNSRSRYAALAGRAGVPWQFLATIHGMEASFNFRAHLHNGDHPLTQRTRQVPAGRPTRWLPPSDWESSALDAMRLLGFTGQSDWSLPRTLYRLEAFNGFGYRRYGRPSPYLWSFSTLYDRGKFVADGRYDPRARSQQCGTATMLKLLDLAGELDLTA